LRTGLKVPAPLTCVIPTSKPSIHWVCDGTGPVLQISGKEKNNKLQFSKL